MRASTPTAAAAIVTPNIEDIKNKLKFNLDKLNNRIKFILESSKACIIKNKENPYIKNYLNIYLEYKRNLETTEKNLQRILSAGIKEKKIDFFYKKEEFLDIDILEKYKENFAKTIEHLEANSPINIMKKGYSITFLEDKKVTSVKEIKPKDNPTVQLLDGVFTCEVKEVLKEGVK